MISEATSCVDIHFGYYNSTVGLIPPKLDLRNEVLIISVVSNFFKDSLQVSIVAMASEMAATSSQTPAKEGLFPQVASVFGKWVVIDA